jgi:glycosyltransferase involved in cell wall biosynthesis
MSVKNILIVCPGQIFPIEMGSQIRMFGLIQQLSQDHCVDVITKVPSRKYLDGEYFQKIKEICNEYRPILAPNKENFFKKAYYKIKRYINERENIPDILFYYLIRKFQQQLIKFAHAKKYDIIISEYWYLCFFYDKLTYRPYLVLDSIDVNFEKFRLELKAQNRWEKSIKIFERYKEFELEFTRLNDLIISVSEYDLQFFKKMFPQKEHLKISIGQDISSYLTFKSEGNSKNTLLFYGSMSSVQNVKAFFRLYNRILPKIKLRIPDTKLIVVGANPPEYIRKLHNGKDIIVTGYVQDIREWITQSCLLVLPLEIAGGFRTRVVEVMAMGVPVIGTHNALDCLEIENEVQGIITDDDDEIINSVIKLLTNSSLRNKMAQECRKFVSEKYSMEATYGKLSTFFHNLKVER